MQLREKSGTLDFPHPRPKMCSTHLKKKHHGNPPQSSPLFERGVPPKGQEATNGAGRLRASRYPGVRSGDFHGARLFDGPRDRPGSPTDLPTSKTTCPRLSMSFTYDGATATKQRRDAKNAAEEAMG